MEITAIQLKKIYPFATKERIGLFLPFINEYADEYDMYTPERMAAFLAQIGHESGQLRYVEEIASGKAYEGRKDLGNIYPGDGVKYKGRGLIQITGRDNYNKLSKALGVDLIGNPEILETPELAVRSAYWFWKNNNLNKYADIRDFKRITRIINGGYNGLKERTELYEKALEVLDV